MKGCVVAFALVVVSARAQPGGLESLQKATSAGVPCNIRAEAIAVKMPQALAMTFIGRFREHRQADDAMADILSGIAKGKIKLLDIRVTHSADNHRAAAESYLEVRYPSESDPVMGGSFLNEPLPKVPHPVFLQDIDVPTAWETRNAGFTLELKAAVAPAEVVSNDSSRKTPGSISMDVCLQDVELLEMKRFLTETSADQGRTQYAQPVFRDAKVTSSLWLRSGSWNLMNVSVIPGEKPETKLFLMRCTAVPVGK